MITLSSLKLASIIIQHQTSPLVCLSFQWIQRTLVSILACLLTIDMLVVRKDYLSPPHPENFLFLTSFPYELSLEFGKLKYRTTGLPLYHSGRVIISIEIVMLMTGVD